MFFSEQGNVTWRCWVKLIGTITLTVLWQAQTTTSGLLWAKIEVEDKTFQGYWKLKFSGWPKLDIKVFRQSKEYWVSQFTDQSFYKGSKDLKMDVKNKNETFPLHSVLRMITFANFCERNCKFKVYLVTLLTTIDLMASNRYKVTATGITF